MSADALEDFCAIYILYSPWAVRIARSMHSADHSCGDELINGDSPVFLSLSATCCHSLHRSWSNIAAAGYTATCIAGPTLQHCTGSGVLFCCALGIGALLAASDNSAAVLLRPEKQLQSNTGINLEAHGLPRRIWGKAHHLDLLCKGQGSDATVWGDMKLFKVLE